MLIVQNWWALALRGILGIVFGLAAIIWPHIALTTFILIFGAYALLDGVVNLAGAWRRAQHHRPWGAHVVEGFIGVIIGLLAFIWPAMAAVTLVTLIAFWAIVTGIHDAQRWYDLAVGDLGSHRVLVPAMLAVTSFEVGR